MDIQQAKTNKQILDNDKLRQLKRKYLTSGSRWAAPDDPNDWILIVDEIIANFRVVGKNPDGNTFRCSIGVFLRKFYPIDFMNELLQEVRGSQSAQVCDQLPSESDFHG